MTKPLYLAAILLACSTLALAQTSAPSATSATSATSAPTATRATSDVDSSEVREQLMSLLESYPPQVGEVLKLDPALLGNHDYLATYPQLAAFVTEHPQVAHSPEFYLERVTIHTAQLPESATVRMWDRTLNDIVPFAVFLVISGIVVWLIKTLVEHRRWSRISHTQSEMFAKLFDRFGSNEELLAYLQSSSGRKVFEAASYPLEPSPRALSAPLGRIFWTVQVGIVATMIGLGLQIVSWRVALVEVATPLSAMAIIVLSIGIGFILSAIVSHILSRRLGLWTPRPELALQHGAARD